MTEYLTIEWSGSPCYLKVGCEGLMSKLKGLVFDCDGVLIDTRLSYDKTIAKTVSYILECLTGIPFPEELTDESIIYGLRGKGGFNNDADSTYTIILYTLAKMPESTRATLSDIFRRNENKFENPATTLKTLKTPEKKIFDSSLLKNLVEESKASILAVLSKFNLADLQLIENALIEQNKLDKRFLDDYKSFMRHPGGTGVSIITTTFEEFFHGSREFEESYGITPVLNVPKGMSENERPILVKETLNRLVEVFGENALGIASGRDLNSAKRTLDSMIEMFNSNGLVFLQSESAMTGGEDLAERNKPAPYCLLKAAKGITDGGSVLYIGDSTEDMIMVKRANSVEKRFYFAGVYNSGYGSETRLKTFMEGEADMIIPTVNDLPDFFETVMM